MKLPPASIQRAVEAFDTVKLGDPRRARRLRHTVAKLAKNPSVSFPESMGSDAEVQGGYRLVNNVSVTLDALVKAYGEQTAVRARAVQRVLCIHDSTKCQFELADPEEVGYLPTGKPGFLFHYTLVVDGEGKRCPLGVVNGEAFFTNRPPRKRRAKGRRRGPSGQVTTKDPNRRSLRWQRGMVNAAKALDGCEIIHVADRESDNYTLFCGGHRFVFRVRVNARRARDPGGVEGTVRELAQRAVGRLTREVTLSARKGTKPGLRATYPRRKQRTAELEFSATKVEISRPTYYDESLPPTVKLGVVRVVERNPLQGEEPVEWLLYTTEPIETEQQIAEVIDIYRSRWLIEECNKALKTGCLYEERQFESRAALLALLGMSLPVACEILWLRNQTREQPTRPAEEVLTPIQIQVLRAMGRRKLVLNPTAHDVMLAVADMAGHRPSNGNPGWLILQRGMTKLLAYVEGWTAALAGRGEM